MATSSATFFRQLGGTLGVAVFLSLLFNSLPDKIQGALQSAGDHPGVPAGGRRGRRRSEQPEPRDRAEPGRRRAGQRRGGVVDRRRAEHRLVVPEHAGPEHRPAVPGRLRRLDAPGLHHRRHHHGAGVRAGPGDEGTAAAHQVRAGRAAAGAGRVRRRAGRRAGGCGPAARPGTAGQPSSSRRCSRESVATGRPHADWCARTVRARRRNGNGAARCRATAVVASGQRRQRCAARAARRRRRPTAGDAGPEPPERAGTAPEV